MTYFVFEKSNVDKGHLTVNIDYNGMSIPAEIFQKENNKFHISYNPVGSGDYTIRVFYDEQEIQGSPFSMEVVDAKDIQTSGEGLTSAEVGQRSSFNVNMGRNVSLSDLKINVTSPKGFNITPQIYDRGGGNVVVEFDPNESGEHLVDIKYLNNSVTGSPFSCQVTDINQIIMTSIPHLGSINRPVEFEIDAMKAGQGKLEILANEGSVPCSVDRQDGFRFRGSFVPVEAIPHVIRMKFNGKEVPGSPWMVDIRNPAGTAVVDNRYQQSVSVNHNAELEVRLNNVDSDVTAQITTPNRRTTPGNVVNMRNGVYMVDFIPREAGTHLVQVLVDGVGVAGNPFVFKAYNSQAIVINSPGMASVGQAVEFSIDASKAGDGLLEVLVNKGNDENVTRAISKGIFQTSFVPKSARPHVVDVFFNKEAIPQTPLTIPVVDNRPTQATNLSNGYQETLNNRQSMLRINQQQLFQGQHQFQGQQLSDEEITLKVTAPNGEHVPAKLIRHPDGNFTTEHTSKYTGQHRVDITSGGVAIMGSPFFTEIYDPQKIKIQGNKTGMVGERLQLEIIRNLAGKAELDLSIKSPRGHAIKYEMVKTSTGERIWYTPQQPGFHTVDLLFGELQVPGCPFKQEIFDSSIVTAEGEGLHEGLEDHEASFVVDPQGQNGDLKVQIDGPNSIAKCSISQDVMGRYIVTYLPMEAGIFKVLLKWNGRELHGSPFKPQISALHKVGVVGGWSGLLNANNLMTLKENDMKVIEFDTKGCGKGQLTATLNSPSGSIPLDIRRRGNDVYAVSFTPREEGEYKLKVFWKGYQIDQWPIVGFLKTEKVTTTKTTAATTTATYEQQQHQQQHQQQNQQHQQQVYSMEKVILTGIGLQQAVTNQQSEFFIDGSSAVPGAPSVVIEGPGGEVPVQCLQLGPLYYKCTYYPSIPGIYSLHITWASHHVNGSPFKVNVQSAAIYGNTTANQNQVYSSSYLSPLSRTNQIASTNHLNTLSANQHLSSYSTNQNGLSPRPPSVIGGTASGGANRVTWQKEGLVGGFVDREMSLLINTSKAAQGGELSVVCQGPTERALTRLEDLRNGVYQMHIKTKEAGAHNVNIRFNKEHINGSPFSFKVNYPIDASKVKCYGPGISPGLLRDFNSDFVVDTSRAGSGELDVYVAGPRNKFRVNTVKERRKVYCSYQPSEAGEYVITVKWSGKDVPGSPFRIRILGSEGEKRGVMRG